MENKNKIKHEQYQQNQEMYQNKSYKKIKIINN